jgi:hypothetical protein
MTGAQPSASFPPVVIPPGAWPVSRIFISHSSANAAEAVALRDWMVGNGWNDLFLDLDPARGIAAGERWDRALNEAAGRCESIIFLVSRAWVSSRWCVRELDLARRLNKLLIGVLIEPGIDISELPPDVTSTWQLLDLADGGDHVSLPVSLPITGEERVISFASVGLARLKTTLLRVGIDASYFAWPPRNDPGRSPYPGLRSFEPEDAGVYFGRNEAILNAIDQLRGLCDAATPRLFTILGLSGVGKSSFLRAGLLPRLERNDEYFLPLPIIRPGRAALYGDTGLLSAIASARASDGSGF